mgnify:FL=1
MNVEITNANHNQSIPAYHDKLGPHTTNPMPIPEVQQDGNVGIAPSFFSSRRGCYNNWLYLRYYLDHCGTAYHITLSSNSIIITHADSGYLEIFFDKYHH